jgi:hypothetical protein
VDVPRPSASGTTNPIVHHCTSLSVAALFTCKCVIGWQRLLRHDGIDLLGIGSCVGSWLKALLGWEGSSVALGAMCPAAGFYSLCLVLLSGAGADDARDGPACLENEKLTTLRGRLVILVLQNIWDRRKACAGTITHVGGCCSRIWWEEHVEFILRWCSRQLDYPRWVL